MEITSNVKRDCSVQARAAAATPGISEDGALERFSPQDSPPLQRRVRNP